MYEILYTYIASCNLNIPTTAVRFNGSMREYTLEEFSTYDIVFFTINEEEAINKKFNVTTLSRDKYSAT